MRWPTTSRCAGRWAIGWPVRRICSTTSSATSTRPALTRSPSPTRWAGPGYRLEASGSGGPTGSRRSAASPATCTPLTPPPRSRRPICCRRGACRANPYLYSDDDIAALISAAASLRTTTRQVTFQTLIGLLVVTGVRVGEVIALDRGDVDLARGLLLIRHAKFGKARQFVVHPSTVDALRRYLRHRDRLDPAPSTPAVFVSTTGTRLRYCKRALDVAAAGPPRRADATLGVVSAPDS